MKGSDLADPTNGPRLLMDEVRAICFGGQHAGGAWKTVTACPACGSDDLAPAFRKYEFEHLRCRICDHIALAKVPPDAVLDALYAGAYYTNVREFYELPRLLKDGAQTTLSAPEDALVEMIDRLAQGRRRGRWLDVGGGFGAFADLVRRHLPGWSVVLNDFNPRSCRIATDVLGLEAISGDVATIRASGRRFDVISAISVIEHIPAPVGFLAAYRELLDPGGQWAVVTPNFTPLCIHVAKAASPAVAPPFHLHLFNATSLHRCLVRAGGLTDISLHDRGAAAFVLTQHVDFSSYYDISIPTADDPVPRTVTVSPLPDEIARQITALAGVDALMSEHFARTDGRVFLFALARLADPPA